MKIIKPNTGGFLNYHNIPVMKYKSQFNIMELFKTLEL